MSASQVIIMNYLLLNNINSEPVFVEPKHKRFKNIHSHINTHVSFKNINQKKIKVSLDGQGADEIFAGYQGFPAHRALSYAENFDFVGLFIFLFNWSRWPGRSFFSGVFYFFSLILTPKSKNFF